MQLQRNKLWFTFSSLPKALLSSSAWEQSQGCKKHFLSSEEHWHCSQLWKFPLCWWLVKTHSFSETLLQFSQWYLATTLHAIKPCLICVSIVSSALPKAKEFQTYKNNLILPNPKCNVNGNLCVGNCDIPPNFFLKMSVLKDSLVDNNKGTVAKRNDFWGLYDKISYGTVLVQ